MPTTEPKPPHGSAEWLAVRHRDPQGRARLTASVAGVLFDCHPFITPAELATQMLAETPPEASWSEAIERGHDLEPVILQFRVAQAKSRVVCVRDRALANVMYCQRRWLANLDDVLGPDDASTSAARSRPRPRTR
jgi:predicted phage-related endonuclease